MVAKAMTGGIFRPSIEPAQTIYDAFQEEAEKRPQRGIDDWIIAERMVVWQAARDYAQQHGLRVPTLADVEAAERQAYGHIDYGAKWAYGVARAMQPGNET